MGISARHEVEAANEIFLESKITIKRGKFTADEFRNYSHVAGTRSPKAINFELVKFSIGR